MMTEKLLQMVLDCGATKATVLEQSDIVLSAEFRAACEMNSCGVFGRCWMCPPDVGPIDELMDRVRSFPRGIWYQTVGEIEDSFDFEGMTEVSNSHAKLSQRILKNTPKDIRSLHLTSGGCRVCAKCAKIDNEPCRFPDRALPSVESYGVDVYNTTKGTNLKYINGANTVTYFGLLLFEEE
ncbi:MAG: DUF2284 domain-containing protein [Clostridia bacterium]|nr:DUF2284 domain-containing protein [Clostridia bacterium]